MINPVGGGSESLAEVTVKYECLAVTEENADGSSRGWPVDATMNFDTGEYTWELAGSTHRVLAKSPVQRLSPGVRANTPCD